MIAKQITLSLENPIIRHHQAYGRHLLPGLAYIDLIYQVFGQHDLAFMDWELKNLSLYAPLIVDAEAKIVLSITAAPTDENAWQLEVTGQKQSRQGLHPEVKRYITAQMLRMPPVVFKDRLKKPRSETSQGTTLDLEDIYARCREMELVHSGFIQAKGHVDLDADGAFIDIAVGEAARSSAGRFLFHPALIDGSAVGAATVCAQWTKDEQRLYLPLFFESFRAAQPLQQRCIARIQSSSLSQKEELIQMTLEFFKPDGEKVAELKNYTMKLVRDAHLIDASRKPKPGSANQSKALVPVVEKQPGAAGVDAAVKFIQRLMAERLNQPLDRIANDTGYYEMGLDSKGLLEIANRIEKQVGTSLPPTLLFEYTTIDTLAAHLAEKYCFNGDDGTNSGSAAKTSISDRQRPEPVETDASQVAVTTATVQPSGDSVADKAGGGDIAIIGMAGRYPKAGNLHEFWENLKEGLNCIQKIPASRWDWRKLDKMVLPNGKKVSKWGGFIEDADRFDPTFFRISPREAAILDPQERLFLQTCWETIEDAGYTPDTLVSPRGRHQRRPVGVFVGVMHKDYTLVGADVAAQGNPYPLSLNYAPIANRVSYFCNFNGPSLAIDTVCSSSLTALHLAIQSLRLGDCEASLAGGVNLSLHPHKYMTYGMADMHSSDGCCRAFGQGGDGYVSGEGVGAVLLKPLATAVSDGDHIYAVIKGSVVNHVGTVSGMTVPSPVAQADLIEACLNQSGIHPRSISCIEAHGTGTSLGDPIEIQGLQKAYQSLTQDKQFCAVGSVKSNIGHAESAAGISGLHKLVLQLYHKTLVPSLHSQTLNPYINFGESPFYVQQKTEVWRQPEVTENGHTVRYPRRAGITSLGASGSNVHILLEEYVPDNEHPSMALSAGVLEPFVIVPLSARNKDRLDAYASRLRLHLKSMAPQLKTKPIQIAYLQQLAYTLQVGRVTMDERIAFISSSINDLIRKIEAYINKDDDQQGCLRGRGKSEATPAEGPSASQDIRELDYSRLEVLAGQWANGAKVPWQHWYGKGQPRRVSLPVYPFAGKRYWAQAVANSKKNLFAPADAPVKQYVEPAPATRVYKTPMVALRPASNPVNVGPTAKPSGVELPVVTAEPKNPDQSTDAPPPSARSPKRLAAPSVEIPIQTEELLAGLRASLAQALFMDEEELDDTIQFVDLGLDSIVGVEWIKTINETYGTDIKATKVYDYPSLCEFAGYLQTELRMNTRALPPLPAEDTLRDLLRQVQQGSIDIDAADQRLAEISLS